MSTSKVKTNAKKTMAIHGIENRKQTKKMEQALSQFSTETEIERSYTEFTGDEWKAACFNTKYLRTLVNLAYGSKATSIDLHLAQDKPLKAVLYRGTEKQCRGEVFIAPRIPDNAEYFKKRRRQHDLALTL